MQRRLSLSRQLSIERKPAIGRKTIGFINDGKIHAVLDTNVIIYALEALFKKSAASQTEKDSLEIVLLLEKRVLVIGLNSGLFEEYRKVAARMLAEQRIASHDLIYILNLVEQNSVGVRRFVDPQRVSPHKNDDVLFDGLATTYLVSNNLNDVKPSKLYQPSSYHSTLSPYAFLNDLRNKKLI